LHLYQQVTIETLSLSLTQQAQDTTLFFILRNKK